MGSSVLIDFLLRPPASFVWGTASDLHRKLYQSGVLPKKSLSKPVISVGNWTMGGTGKTPFTDWLLDLAKQQNKKTVVLSRGYGRSTAHTQEVLVSSEAREVGDEPLLLKMHHPEAPVFVGSSRYHAGQEALKKYQPDFFILDDGFQHHQLVRKTNIVLIDATQGPVKHKVFPLGWARESAECLQHADWIVHTKTNFVDEEVAELRRKWIESLLSKPIPILSAEYRLDGYFDFQNAAVTVNKTEKVFALAGIGQPEVFFKEVRKDFDVIQERPFADHQEYTGETVQELLREIKQRQARWLVVTEKDWVKLKEFKELHSSLLIVKRKMFIQESEALNAFRNQIFV